MAQLIPVFLLSVPLAGAVLVLVMIRSTAGRLLSIIVPSIASLVLSVILAMLFQDEMLYPVGGWEGPYGIAFRVDALSLVMLLLTGIVFSAATLYEAGSGQAGQEKERALYHFTFPLLLFALNGLFLTADFFNFYVFFELAAITSYLLVVMGAHHPFEACWKYATQSVLGSALLLAGIAFIYGASGSLNMSDVASRLTSPVAWLSPVILVAFLLKGSLFPFHLWQPDAHAAATTPGSAVLAGVLINIGIYGLLRFSPVLFPDHMMWIFLWLGGTSVFFGGIAAWTQPDVKRILGFSSTSQLGFVLIGLGWGTHAGRAAAVFFMANHALTKALLFLCSGVITDWTGSTKSDEVSGRGAHAPWLRAAFLLGVLSLVGLPPAVGFFAKILLLKEGVSLGSWPWAATVLLGSVITLAYAGRLFQTLFSHKSASDDTGQEKPPIALLAGVSIILVAGLVLVLGIAADLLWTLSDQAAADMKSLHGGGKQ